MNLAGLLSLAIVGALMTPGVPPQPIPSTPGIKIRAASLGLELTAPEGWRLSRESTPEQLVFYPGKKKVSPLLRVRAFKGNLSPRDRLAEMTRGLPEEEAGVHFVAGEKWSSNRRRFETATATYKQGAREWHASFTLADQPGRVQHGFWLFGSKKDIERHWKGIQASISSAKRVSITGSGIEDARKEDPKKAESGSSVWSDARSGLVISSWPAGFAPEPRSVKELAKDGLLLVPSDDSAHTDTRLVLTSRPASKGSTASDLAAVLHTELGARGGVEQLRRIPVRIGGQEAALLTWTDNGPDGAAFVHSVYYLQRAETVIRIAFDAEERWARTRSRRGLVKDFVGGVRFE
jgi:hypothetical protein